MQAEKGFRLLKCPECPKQIRITVTVAMYGKTGNVNCGCGARLRVTIPTPPHVETPPSETGPTLDDRLDAMDTSALEDLFGTATKNARDLFRKKKKE